MNLQRFNFTFNFFFFITILVLARIIPHSPNFSPIIASAIIAPLYLNSRPQGLIVTLLAMFISDIYFLGFSTFQIFIYITIGSVGLLSSINSSYYKYTLYAILGSIWFYLVTNFGVWLIWDYYEKSINGLINCYILALPFFTNTLFSSVLFTFLFLFFYKPYSKIIFYLFNQLNKLLTKPGY